MSGHLALPDEPCPVCLREYGEFLIEAHSASRCRGRECPTCKRHLGRARAKRERKRTRGKS